MNEANKIELAEKIARLLQDERPGFDLSSLQQSIEKLNSRLDNIEARFETSHTVVAAGSVHPSLDKFAVVEAIVDEIFTQNGKEKACTFEPNGKPCDHCSMCNSRGF